MSVVRTLNFGDTEIDIIGMSGPFRAQNGSVVNGWALGPVRINGKQIRTKKATITLAVGTLAEIDITALPGDVKE